MDDKISPSGLWRDTLALSADVQRHGNRRGGGEGGGVALNCNGFCLYPEKKRKTVQLLRPTEVTVVLAVNHISPVANYCCLFDCGRIRMSFV